jgi:hypothetical protein
MHNRRVWLSKRHRTSASFYSSASRSAGFDVTIYDEPSGEEQVFDIGQLRLRFSVVKQGSQAINVRFDPWTARFSGKGVDFTWSELMFRPKLCLNRLFLSV